MADFHATVPLLQLPVEHVSVLHGPARTGHVAIATRAPGWRERAIPVEDLRSYLETLPLGVDVYLSQARFRGWRRTQLLSTLNALWVDLDGGSRERELEVALYALLSACEAREIPAPSYVLGTGRGLAAVWLVEVLPREVLPRWQALQAVLCEALRPLGADPRARDAARVLRLAGTLNTAPVPARLVRCLYPQVGSPHVHGFEALCEALLPLSRPERVREAAPRRRSSPRVARLVRSSGADAKLWADRLADLDRLLELRWFGALPPGHRDVWAFLGAAALSWMIPPAAVSREVRTLAVRAIGGAWGEREVESRLCTVLRRAEAAGRGEAVTWQGVQVDPRYRFRTSTILEWLDVSPDEQREFRTLIGPEERARRYREHQARRGGLGGRASGERRRATLGDRDAEIARLRGEGLSQREIAQRLGVSRKVVRGALDRVGPEA